jgi:hypothetical protein
MDQTDVTFAELTEQLEEFKGLEGDRLTLDTINFAKSLLDKEEKLAEKIECFS